MDITIITPTTNHPRLIGCIESVRQNGLSDNHLIVSDGAGELNIFTSETLILKHNTGRNPKTNQVTYFGHRVYSAMSFLVNTKWIYFLDEDNRLAPNFAEHIVPALRNLPATTPAITFRRSIHHPDTHELIGYDDFESVPERYFADTGCIVWNKEYYAKNIAGLAYSELIQDWAMSKKMYLDAATNRTPLAHIRQYLLEYASPEINLDFFYRNCTLAESDRAHLGGWIDGGDPNTYMPDVWQDLLTKHPDIRNVLDIGCGAGYNMEWFMGRLNDVFGVEGDIKAIDKAVWRNKNIKIYLHDYKKEPSWVSRREDIYDLAICTEFAEHIESKYEDNWLTDLSDFKYILFTHALPGQGGYHHVNEQPESYWIERFAKYGFTPDWDFTNKHRDPSVQWGRNTLILFVRRK